MTAVFGFKTERIKILGSAYYHMPELNRCIGKFAVCRKMSRLYLYARGNLLVDTFNDEPNYFILKDIRHNTTARYKQACKRQKDEK